MHLGSRILEHIATGNHGTIPVEGSVEGGVKTPDRLPTELKLGLGAGQAKALGLVGMGSAVDLPARAFAPLPRAIFDDPRDRPLIFARRAKVPTSREANRFVKQRFRKNKAATERLEHVLPWPRRRRIANCKRGAGRKSAHDIGNKAFGGPIAAPDDVAGTYGCHADVIRSQK